MESIPAMTFWPAGPEPNPPGLTGPGDLHRWEGAVRLALKRHQPSLTALVDSDEVDLARLAAICPEEYLRLTEAAFRIVAGGLQAHLPRLASGPGGFLLTFGPDGVAVRGPDQTPKALYDCVVRSFAPKPSKLLTELRTMKCTGPVHEFVSRAQWLRFRLRAAAAPEVPDSDMRDFICRGMLRTAPKAWFARMRMAPTYAALLAIIWEMIAAGQGDLTPPPSPPLSLPFPLGTYYV
ncbi:hypothetical protein C8A00DRAFT_33656 [Chaetomidium leptoderma]|uniref:Uncharacterized protein n=1 Tax=Chaetomidium leptoderma TaxID=669021 RepID=A0AAN6VLR5_9PEZI|nr:hypothetical protein C8A00DRAFT_33656 [Chaetomidium leptoderma]